MTEQQDTDAVRTAYRERAHLVAFLAAWCASHIGHTDPNEPDWAVLVVETSAGQMSWHIAPDDMDLFAHVPPTGPSHRPWDGHTAEQKYQRLAALADRGRRYDDLANHLQHLPVLVRFTRRARGLNLREAAAESGVSFNTLSRVERGRACDVPTAIKILRWLDRETPEDLS